MEDEIYLDWAATSCKKPPQVAGAMKDFIDNIAVSSGRGAYKKAFTADGIVYECRKEAAKLFSAPDPARIVLTSGATESLNIVLKGFLKEGDHVITTYLEHNAVIRTLHRLVKERGISYTAIKCDSNGYFNPNDFRNAIIPSTKLFAINHASNVTGNILPVSEISLIAHSFGVKVLLDAAQSAGSIKIDVIRDGVDFIAFAGHKSLLGPQGTGGLYIAEGIAPDPLKDGGTGSDSRSLAMPENLPERFEAGTMNYPGIAGLREGIKYINDIGVENIRENELEVIGYALEQFSKLKHVKLYGCKNASDIVGVFSFNIDGIIPAKAAHILDMEHNIMVRAGLHCAPLAHESIGTIDTGAIRASIGFTTTTKDIDRLIDALGKMKNG